MVGEADAELAVDLCFVCWVGVAQGVQQATERVHHRADVVSAHPSVRAVVTGRGVMGGWCIAHGRRSREPQIEVGQIALTSSSKAARTRRLTVSSAASS